MKLETRAIEKVWGRRNLPPPFAHAGAEQIGEIWFEPPAELAQVLVKYLFTTEKLSVQVHPSDGHAPPGASGKDECWLVLDAEPGATVAMGFTEAITAEAMRAAALDGSIESLLEWHPARAGDLFYLPAGTVHAIGPGLTLVEVQQNSDITYRLYDYGRPRALQLAEGIAAAKGEPHPAGCRRRVAADSSEGLVDGPYFRFSQLCGPPDPAMQARHRGAVLALPLEGSIIAGDAAIAAGECGFAARLDAIDFRAAVRTLLVSAS